MELGEFVKISGVKNVILRRKQHHDIEGDLCLTGHQLLFSPRSGPPNPNEFIEVLYSNVWQTVQKPYSSPALLHFKLKDLSSMTLFFPSAENHEIQRVAESVEKLTSLQDPKLSYPFYYHPRFDTSIDSGWLIFNIEEELNRMECPPNKWRISSVNSNYTVCPSYPARCIVPMEIDDNTLIKVSKFRQAGRFPVLSYYHSSKESAILRSGEPLVGVGERRSKEDIGLLKASLSTGKRGFILDLRTATEVKQRKARGGGIEVEAHYPHWRRVHCPIEHKLPFLQDSLIKLLDACTDKEVSSSNWLSKLDSSMWLTHVTKILTAACTAAQCVERDGSSVLLHDTIGYDGTVQVACLAQVLLDPWCRTINGFKILIEREWLSSGHPFGDRCGQIGFQGSEQAPIFLLFLDCVWQVMQQFVFAFEFNETFLRVLFENSSSSCYGTFLGNNEQQRNVLNVSARSVSLWTYLAVPDVASKLINPIYERHSSVLWPSVAPQSIILWSGLYLRWEGGPEPMTDYDAEVQRVVTKHRRMRQDLDRCKEELQQLRDEEQKAANSVENVE
jgi:myotubularin-related protein 9